MKLNALSYSELEGTGEEWRLNGLSLGLTNLIVGRNASGKTRTLNVIRALAGLLFGDKLMYRSGNYEASFSDDVGLLQYSLHYENSKVVREQFSLNGEVLMDRGEGGRGRIRAVALEGEMEFQTPEDQLAAVARRDAIQHPFLEGLHQWGASLRHWLFGSALGKEFLTLPTEGEQPKGDMRDTGKVVPIFLQGQRELQERFTQAVLEDMAAVGFSLSRVDVGTPVSMNVLGPFARAVLLRVKEDGLISLVDQNVMAQGMYRSLTLILEANYYLMSSQPSCFLIDDIGEGLDFERSCALIKLLMRKTAESDVQLIMSTNDRFVMNSVPLHAWTVLRRDGNKLAVFNYKNSKEKFDEFRMTGLSNFDFFSYDFLGDGGEAHGGNEG